MESIHDEATRYGIERPETERYEYMEGTVIVSALTAESEALWADYLRAIGLARIALHSELL